MDSTIIKEYYERNERKKQDEKWLKENKSAIEKIMNNLGKKKADFGKYRVSLSIPDTSHFDMDKVLEFCKIHQIPVLKEIVDEKLLTEAIEKEEIKLEELKEFAWVESKGTPRLNVKVIE